MPKHKTHKGLLKRVKITATGKVKFKSSRSGHLRSHRTGEQIRSLGKKKIAKSGDVIRFEKMLQLRLRGADQGPAQTPPAEKKQA